MSKQKSTIPTVTASDIGKAEYCPYALYLARKKVRPSKKAKQSMRKGTVAHKEWDLLKDQQNTQPIPKYKILIAIVVLAIIWLIASSQ